MSTPDSQSKRGEAPRKWLLVILGALALVLGGSYAVAQAGWFRNQLSEVEMLRSLPEADLLYPGSEVISRGGHEDEPIPTGSTGAVTWQLVGVDASPSDIMEWYTAELTRLGWTEGGGSSRLGVVGELSVNAWDKDGVVFRLGIRDPDYWRANPEIFARYHSVYDAALIADD